MTWRRRLLVAAPLFAIVAVVAVRSLRAVEGRPDVGFDVPGTAPGSYFLTQWRVVALYLRLLAWPAGQRVEWELEASRGLAEAGVLGAGLVLAALLGAAVAGLAWGRRREGPPAALARVAGVGVLWFFLVLSVTSSVVPLADLVMEHRPYLASWGVLVAACAVARAALERLPARLAPRAAAAAAGAAWVALAVALFLRNAAWESNVALWRDTVEKSPRSARARLGLGHALRRGGDADGAVREYEAALALAGTRDLRVASLRNLGAAQLGRGQTHAAVETLRQALAIDPANPEVLTNLAVALHRLRDVAGAEASALAALRADRNQAEALTVLGAIHMERDDAAGALPFLAAAVAVEPDVARHHVNVGMALDRVGRTGEACAAWRRAIALGLEEPGRAALAARARARACP